MKTVLYLLSGGLLAGALLLLLAAQFGWLGGTRPSDLGVTQSRFKPPSLTRNSVSSQAGLYPEHPQRAYAQIEPLPLKNADPAQAMRALLAALHTLPGITVIEQGPDYLHVEARTRWLKFVDDLEFWVNPAAQVIELRSASRLGREDFGVNRQRIDALRAVYLAMGRTQGP